jgi:hypothetical protein
MKKLTCIPGLLLLSASLVSPAAAQRSGEATAEVSVRGGAKRWPEANRWTATVKRGGEDRVSYTVEKEVPYGAPYPAIQTIDPDGRSLVVDSFDGVVELFDAAGILVRTWKPFAGSGPDHERILKCVAAKDGVVFLCSEPGSVSARVMKTDINLKMLWSRTLSGQSAGELVVSGDGGIVAVCSYSSDPGFLFETLIVDAGGAVLGALPSLFRAGDIDPEGDRFLLTDGRSVVWGNVRGDLEAGRWRLPEEAAVVSDARLIPGGGCVLVLQRVQATADGLRYIQPELLLLDSEARITGRKKMIGESERQATLLFESGKVTVVVGETSFQCDLADLK